VTAGVATTRAGPPATTGAPDPHPLTRRPPFFRRRTHPARPRQVKENKERIVLRKKPAIAVALGAALLLGSLTGAAPAAAAPADKPAPSITVAAAAPADKPAPSITVAAAAPADKAAPSDTVSPTIIGGRPASQVYEAMGSLQRQLGDNPDWHSCGAILISLGWAVTNAHCVTNDDGTARDPLVYHYHLRFGSNNRLSGGVVVDVSRILPHEMWDWGAGDDAVADLAVLKLATPVRGIRPFQIPRHLNNWSDFARIIGWGITALPWEGPAPIDLDELDTRIVSASNCAIAGITVGEICVGDPANTKAGPCYGESGGPVLQPVPHSRTRWVAVGGASRETTDTCTGSTVYTDLSAYRTWIFKVVVTGKVPPRAPGGQVRTPARAYHWAGSM
jgi:secreted trypsin-like serine protease